MKLGFTGSRAGMSDAQCKEVIAIIEMLKPTTIIHGDCVGSDAQIHEIAIKMGIKVAIYPCTLIAQRAFCSGAEIVHEPLPPLERNHYIVHSCDKIIAAPKEHEEILRSGTWATIRYALKAGKSLIICFPDGTTSLKYTKVS